MTPLGRDVQLPGIPHTVHVREVAKVRLRRGGSSRCRMEADQQDAADSTGGQSDGYSWEFSNDGRFDATENWRRIQSARIRNETAEEAEDQRTEPTSVARDMIAAQEDGGKAALRAAQILEERFKLWDRAEQDRRRQEFVAHSGAGTFQL